MGLLRASRCAISNSNPTVYSSVLAWVLAVIEGDSCLHRQYFAACDVQQTRARGEGLDADASRIRTA